MQIDLTGRVALVTGSTRGIGRAIATTLAGAGARVAVVGRERARAEEAASQLGGEARGFSCDVADTASVAALVEEVEKTFGSLDINVGMRRFRPMRVVRLGGLRLRATRRAWSLKS